MFLPNRFSASNQRMENKMAQLDAVDEAKWTASQIAIAKREEALKQKRLKSFMDREHADSPVSFLELSPSDLAYKYQQHQGETNFCASYAISTALNMLYGANTKGSDVADLVSQSNIMNPPPPYSLSPKWSPVYSWLPSGGGSATLSTSFDSECIFWRYLGTAG